MRRAQTPRVAPAQRRRRARRGRQPPRSRRGWSASRGASGWWRTMWTTTASSSRTPTRGRPSTSTAAGTALCRRAPPARTRRATHSPSTLLPAGLRGDLQGNEATRNRRRPTRARRLLQGAGSIFLSSKRDRAGLGALCARRQVKGKVNAITVDGCQLVNSASVQVQVTGVVPTIAVDKCDGVQVGRSVVSHLRSPCYHACWHPRVR